jgi:hypothetical protein
VDKKTNATAPLVNSGGNDKKRFKDDSLKLIGACLISIII